MSIFKKDKVAIGKEIASRCKRYPVWEDNPKKSAKKSAVWIRVPIYSVKPPKHVDREAEDQDYPLFVRIFAETRAGAREALDYMIGCGREEIEAGDKRFWLYAVKHSVRHSGLFQAELKYIFRVRQIPEEEIL